jgi:hypothetical protein
MDLARDNKIGVSTQIGESDDLRLAAKRSDVLGEGLRIGPLLR